MISLSIPLPSHQELAAIAASFPTGDPKSRALAALDVWAETWSALEREKKIRADIQERQAKDEKHMAGLNLRDGMSLDELLRELMPRAKTYGDRLAKYRVYVRGAIRMSKWMDRGMVGNLSDIPDTTDDEIQNAIERERNTPFPLMLAEHIASTFRVWDARQTKAALKERAGKAAKARHGKKSIDPEKSRRNSRKQASPSAKQKSSSAKQAKKRGK